MKSPSRENPMADLQEYWQGVREHKWLIVLLTVGISLAAAVMIAMLPNRYKATTTIIVESQKIPDNYVEDTVQSKLTDQLETIREEVLSATALQAMIKQFNLYPDLGKSLPPEQLIDHMRKDISIEVKYATGAGPGAFSITYEGKNPQLVAAVANQLASQFIDWNLKAREELATGTTQFLDNQLSQAQANLEKQEDQIREFKMTHLGELPDQEPANLQAVAQEQTALQANSEGLDRLEQERMQLLSRRPVVNPETGQVVDSGGARAQLEQQKSLLEAQLWQLEKVYVPTFPDVVAVKRQIHDIDQRLRALPSTPPPVKSAVARSGPVSVRLKEIAFEMTRLRTQQKNILAAIAAYQAKVDAAPLREQQLDDLTRNYAITKKQYDSLLEKHYQAGMAGDMERDQDAQHFRVLDPARIPEKPYSPRRRILMAGVVAGALIFSIGLALALEKLSLAFKGEKDLKQLLPSTVVVFGTIPTIETPRDKRRQMIYGILAVAGSLAACVAVAFFIGRIHPIL